MDTNEEDEAWCKESLKKISAIQKQLDELRVMLKTKTERRYPIPAGRSCEFEHDFVPAPKSGESPETSKGDAIAEKVSKEFMRSLYEKEREMCKLIPIPQTTDESIPPEKKPEILFLD